MEHELWKGIVALLRVVDKPRNLGRCTFTNEAIALVWLWAVVNDRPVSWADNAFRRDDAHARRRVAGEGWGHHSRLRQGAEDIGVRHACT